MVIWCIEIDEENLRLRGSVKIIWFWAVSDFAIYIYIYLNTNFWTFWTKFFLLERWVFRVFGIFRNIPNIRNPDFIRKLSWGHNGEFRFPNIRNILQIFKRLENNVFGHYFGWLLFCGLWPSTTGPCTQSVSKNIVDFKFVLGKWNLYQFLLGCLKRAYNA